MKTIQVGTILSEGGRNGKVEAPDGSFSVDFRSEEGSEITPEHLFAAAYSACFHSALKSAAQRAHADIDGSTVSASVRLEEDKNGGYQLGVELRASIPGVSRSDGEHLLNLAHQSCPYSKATRGNIVVDLALD